MWCKNLTTTACNRRDTCGFWLTIGIADPILVLGSDVTTISSRSIGAPMIDCFAANELDTGRQTQVNIVSTTQNSIQVASLSLSELNLLGRCLSVDCQISISIWSTWWESKLKLNFKRRWTEFERHHLDSAVIKHFVELMIRFRMSVRPRRRKGERGLCKCVSRKRSKRFANVERRREKN